MCDFSVGVSIENKPLYMICKYCQERGATFCSPVKWSSLAPLPAATCRGRKVRVAVGNLTNHLQWDGAVAGCEEAGKGELPGRWRVAWARWASRGGGQRAGAAGRRVRVDWVKKNNSFDAGKRRCVKRRIKE